MEAGEIEIGAPVTIAAADEFYAFIDGWQGKVAGWQGGYVVVKVQDEDMWKTFLVPPAQLRRG